MADLSLSAPTTNSPHTDWQALARRSLWERRLKRVVLIVVLSCLAAPIVLSYLWMLVLSLTPQQDQVSTAVFWPLLAIVAPLFLAILALQATRLDRRATRLLSLVTCCIGGVLVVVLIGQEFTLSNYRFLIDPNISETLHGQGTVGGQFPSVWVAFGNSLLLAGSQTIIVVIVSTLAAYYLSRFSFVGRAGFLQGMLILQAFPAITLVIPLFVIIFNVGLLNTLWGPMLVLTTLELPFFIFIMKGFFDAVPWDIERAALADGASRRQAFWLVVLPQVRGGMIAVAVFAFIKGWEEYVFVSALRTGNAFWVMSTYLYYVAEDVMGVDYGMVAAVSVIYLAPSLLLYIFCQKYLTQMSVGGIKG
ncbi:carbohydrate ABC transporter permease [Shimia sp. R11_0]|uniref:carbohydrate ABC transporter permease n=1 Tax=Shimia sp. R11_0 TaxID=2821096 RepID=UPI001ADB7194|nr:carbohydrate ABC transporter permease [Shimia sp. R11_0]MBO9477901.1 carbohydrate ABC transporter permease [Shimia sp. R11_0]